MPLATLAMNPAEIDAATGESQQIIVPAGTFRHPDYGTVTIGPDEIQRFADNFRAGVRVLGTRESNDEVPVLEYHDKGTGTADAAGWIKSVKPTPGGLLATIAWNELGVRLVKSRQRPYFSPELLPRYTDLSTGRTYRNVLNGGALVARPFHANLPSVQIVTCADPEPIGLMVFGDHLEGSPSMNLDENEVADGTAGETTTQTATPPPAAAATLTDTDADQQQQDYADPVKVRAMEAQLAAMSAKMTAMERDQAIQTYGDTLSSMAFGDAVAAPLRLAPAGVKTVAEALADAPPELADKILAAVSGLQVYHDGVIGHGGNAAASKLTPEQDRVRIALGQSVEEYLAGGA